MKKLWIKSPFGEAQYQMEDPTDFLIEIASTCQFGKPEKWVPHKDEPMSEVYDESDVLEEREVVLVEARERIPEVSNDLGEEIGRAHV